MFHVEAGEMRVSLSNNGDPLLKTHSVQGILVDMTIYGHAGSFPYQLLYNISETFFMGTMSFQTNVPSVADKGRFASGIETAIVKESAAGIS